MLFKAPLNKMSSSLPLKHKNQMIAQENQCGSENNTRESSNMFPCELKIPGL